MLNILVALLVLLAPLACAGPPIPVDEASLFARPQAIQRLADDPWLGGVWIGTDAGLFFKDTSSGALRHYGYNDGLQHNKVTDLHVTAGKIWIATLGGVSVLDKGLQSISEVTLAGARFPHASRTVFVDDRGAWLGTAQEGLFRVPPGSLAASHVPDPRTGQKFPGSVEGLGASGAELFISVNGHGLTIWNRDLGTATLHDKVYVGTQPAFGRILVRADEVWIGTEGDGVVRLARSNAWQTSEFSSPETTGAMSVYRPILAGSAIYMPTLHGAARYDVATKAWRQWNVNDMGNKANEIVLHGGEVYAALAFGTIRKLDRATDQWQPIDWWEKDRMIAHNLVQSCQVDGSLLAFGTIGGGANYFDPTTGVWTRAGSFQWENGKPDNIGIHAMASAPDKRYYGLNKGVSEVDRSTGEYVHYYTDGRVGDGRGHNPVDDIAVDGPDVWFATLPVMQPKARATSLEVWNPGGLARMDRATHALELFGAAHGLTDQNVTDVAVDAQTVWTGTRSGLFSFDKQHETFSVVPSSMGQVNDLVVGDGAIWAATGSNGIWRIDASTRVASQVPGWTGGAAVSLLMHEGTLWVGTFLAGLHAYDPMTQQWTSHHSGQPVDVVGFCLLVHDGTLYVAGGWGIERFDLATQRFLPQLAKVVPSTAAGGPGPSVPAATGSISIAPIATPWMSPTLTVHGTATMPEDAIIQVRSGRTGWQEVTGSDWSATFALPDGTHGEDTVIARITQAGQVLAQTSAEFAWQLGDAPATQGQVGHVHVAKAWIGVPVRFEVDGRGLPGVQATLELWRPQATTPEEILFEPAPDGMLTATPTPFEAAGDAGYRIRVTWEGGSQSFPEEFSSFGDRYSLLVQAPLGKAGLHVPATPPVTVQPGNTTTASFYVNNIGESPIVAQLAFTGEAGNWVVSAPTSVTTQPGGSTPMTVTLDVPATTAPGTHVLGIELLIAGKLVLATSMDIQVEGDGLHPRGDDGSAIGASGPGIVLVGLALLFTALRRRR